MESVPLQQQYSGFYRPILTLAEPWVGSPELDKPSAIASAYYRHTISHSTLPSPKTFVEDESTPLPTPDPTPSLHPKGKRRVFANLLRRFADKISGDTAVPIEARPSLQPIVAIAHETSPEPDNDVPLRDWKAWGYYACPKLHGKYIANYPPSSRMPPAVDVEEVFRSLQDESRNVYPDRWIRGLQHPALPPRPTRWKDPPKDAPLPFPWHCQLNPLLQHFTFGRPPLDWDICFNPERCFLGRTGEANIPASDADKAQPATYPFVTHMYINALGDDPYPEHFWPFYVVNEHGVTVGDVLNQIYENFQQYTSIFEYRSWRNLLSRQHTTQVAFEMRGGHALDSKARRLDILGTQCQFRGLEPHPNREGWTMFLGLG
ncbi:hypothetical protein C0991_002097 [Blastosporella zonata]|nr:hypothetical protein C0991_002097 [Blastosporella zonata]